MRRITFAVAALFAAATALQAQAPTVPKMMVSATTPKGMVTGERFPSPVCEG